MDISIIADTKLDSPFPQDQFIIPGYKRPERLDVSDSIKAAKRRQKESTIIFILAIDPG